MPWFTLSILSILLIMLVLVPYYGSGIHLMSTGEIWEANNTRNLAEWYPLFRTGPGIDNVYTWAMWIWGIWFYISIPTLAVQACSFIARWRVYMPRGKALRLSVLILAGITTGLYIHAFSGVSAWLFD